MYLLIKKLIFIIIFSNENSQILFQLLFWPSQVVLISLMQDEQLVKGVRDMKRRRMASFLAPMEKSIRKKLCEKDVETEDINRKNRELVERIKQAAVEAQNWLIILTQTIWSYQLALGEQTRLTKEAAQRSK